MGSIEAESPDQFLSAPLLEAGPELPEPGLIGRKKRSDSLSLGFAEKPDRSPSEIRIGKRPFPGAGPFVFLAEKRQDLSLEFGPGQSRFPNPFRMSIPGHAIGRLLFLVPERA
jgi:hypothetical protein